MVYLIWKINENENLEAPLITDVTKKVAVIWNHFSETFFEALLPGTSRLNISSYKNEELETLTKTILPLVQAIALSNTAAKQWLQF